MTSRQVVVCTFASGAHRESAHPSYRAWSYAPMIEDYNEAVRDAEMASVTMPRRLWSVIS